MGDFFGQSIERAGEAASLWTEQQVKSLRRWHFSACVRLQVCNSSLPCSSSSSSPHTAKREKGQLEGRGGTQHDPELQPPAELHAAHHPLDGLEWVHHPCISTSITSHYTLLPHRREEFHSFKCGQLLCLYTLVKLQPTSTLFPFSASSAAFVVRFFAVNFLTADFITLFFPCCRCLSSRCFLPDFVWLSSRSHFG